jgi:rhodanese-related sulfurtransferase
MPTSVDTREVIELVAAGAQLVEVLPAAEYDDEHLPGAVSVPSTELDEARDRGLDPSRPTVVYCYDFQCDLSPRAACRLEQLGFEKVYDYTAGKAAWAGSGLPIEGAGARDRAGELVRRDVPICMPTDTLSQLPSATAEWGLCVVVGGNGCVQGVVPSGALAGGAGDTPVSAVVKHPNTLRPSARREDLLEHFRATGRRRAIVTTLDGTLVGVVRRDDVDGRSGASS